jgi:predicted dehydrogenase
MKPILNPSRSISAQTAVCHRRAFIKSLALGALSFTGGGPALIFGADAATRLRVAVVGLGRGLSLAESLLEVNGIEIAYLSDVDDARLQAGLKSISAKTLQPPMGQRDFRRILDDASIDAMVFATCNHWHAPATILACAAGKHVYVEKPGSHNAHESMLMVAAALKHRRIVQQGTQRRSYPKIREGIERLHKGIIGRVTYARCWYNNARASIGRGKHVPAPPNLDYALWQGPAPDRPYVDNLVHYNWHWRWHWGNGELGNNGIHYLDLARWGLGVDYPTRITYNGGRYDFQDDQETPDTGVVVYHFGDQGCSWEHSSGHPRKGETFPLASFYGEGGILMLEGSGYRILDAAGKEIERASGPSQDSLHLQNFVDCIRNGGVPNASIEEGQKSALLCHLGNIAYRTAQTVKFDPRKRVLEGDSKTRALWKREYRKGWAPVV